MDTADTQEQVTKLTDSLGLQLGAVRFYSTCIKKGDPRIAFLSDTLKDQKTPISVYPN
jgi:hypothetical protein